MPGAAFAAALLLMLGQTQWDARLRAEGRGLRDAAGDLQLDPELGIESLSRETALRARYDPQLIFREPSSRGTLDVLHRAELSAAMRVERDTSVTLSQRGSIGAMYLSWLSYSPDSPPPINVQGADAVAPAILDEMSSVTVTERLTTGVALSVTGGFGITGALHEQDLAALPRTTIAELSASTSWTDRRDAYSVTADGRYGWVSNGYNTDAVEASVAWRHAFTVASERALTESVVAPRDESLGPRYETELRGGVALLGGNDPAQQGGATPTASFTLAREVPRRPGELAMRIALRYAPVIDPTTGLLLARLEGSTAIDLRIERSVVASVAAGLGFTPDPGSSYPRAVSQGGLALTYEPAPGIGFSAGARVARIPQTEWAAVVSTTLSERGRF